jgi:hypothetical protein
VQYQNPDTMPAGDGPGLPISISEAKTFLLIDTFFAD